MAIDTARLQADASGKWSFFTGAYSKANLQLDITGALAQQALSPKYIELQREYARQTVIEFVQKWVLSQEQWRAGNDYQVRVFFPDETKQLMQSFGLVPAQFRE